jgi:hypothetical protein
MKTMTIFAADDSRRARLAIIAIALVILIVRMPNLFRAPEFWAEDALLYEAAYNSGWASLLQPLGGAYFNLYGSLVANIAVHFPPIFAPWIQGYAAQFACLLTVFIVSSPRFDFPYKPLAALAVVATPIQDNTFGGLANAQWILPVGLFALLFSRASRNPWTLLPESVLTAMIGLNGPLGCFLVPLFVWRAWKSEDVERRRLVVLSAILIACSIIQVAVIAQNLRMFNLAEPMPYDHIVWITMPLRWFDAIRLAAIFGKHIVGAAIVIIGGGFLIWFSFKQPYRDQKLAMIFFAALILYSGMYKFRHFLYLYDNDRYVYVGSVFSFWFLCIWAATVPKVRTAVVALTALLIVVSVARRVDDPRPTAAIPWAKFAPQIGKGPISIPVAPADMWRANLSH